jgi:hypothetical protein
MRSNSVIVLPGHCYLDEVTIGPEMFSSNLGKCSTILLKFTDYQTKQSTTRRILIPHTSQEQYLSLEYQKFLRKNTDTHAQKRYEGETDNSIVCQIYWNYWQMLELISKIPPHLNLWFINLVISNGQLRHIPSAGRNFNGDSTSNIDNKQPAISSSIHKLQQPKSKPLVFTKIRT